MDLSPIAVPSPDFTQALGVPFPTPSSGETPTNIRIGVARLRQIEDRREKLNFGLLVLQEMLYFAECPEDFLTIANLISQVRAEVAALPA